MTRLIATVFFVGLVPRGPGTAGSLAALPLGWALHVAGGPWLLVAGILATFAVGLWATAQETRRTGVEDASEIVIDEVAGQWVALLPLSFGAVRAEVDILALWPGWIVAFAAFRLFDIWKVGPVGWADRRSDPLGVMLDDIIAGVLAALVVVVLAGLAHGLMT